METIILKNGQEEAKGLVTVTMLSIKSLLNENPIVFFELVEKCKDRNHKFFGNAGNRLKELALVQSDGSVNSSIKNIVLSSVEGEGLDMTIGSPIKE